MRAVESAAGASTSKNVEIAGGTADSAVDAEDTTEGVKITEVEGSGEPDPPACSSLALCVPGLLHLPLLYFNFLCIGDNCMSFCCGWGK